jgi:ATP-dependent DNA helicase RecG
LFFGIHPKTLKILGQDVADQTRQDIAKELRKFVPAIDLFAQYVDVPGRPNQKVIAIWFPAPMGYAAPYTYDSRPYYKVENTTAVMPREMFDERIRLSDPKKFSWELAPCREATLDDIDENTLTAAIRGGIAKGRIPASAADAVTLPERLSPFKVLLPGDALTNGAIALFGKDPYKFFNHCRVRLARFEGTIMDKFRDQAVIDANLFQQLQAIEDFCRKHMFMSGDQDQFDSKNVLTVPLKVVREAALNLLIHRTWWSEGRTPSVNIFDDRVEFMNPGAFPPGTTPADFRHRPHSVLVNEVIANALFKGGKTEGWGRGILDIFTLCKEAGLPEPEYDFVPNFVCLTIRFKEPITPHLSGDKKDDRINDKLNDRLNEELSAPVRSTYLLVRENPGIQRKELSKKSGKSVPTIDRHLAELQEKGFVVHEGPRKTGGYYVKE